MNQPTPATPVPETNAAREMGAQMAKLREQFGLSQQEVSERLHIRARYVSAIEEGKYELMPGLVYARGYVQTYAEFLGMNPDETVAKCFAGAPPSNKLPPAPIAAARYATPTARLQMQAASSTGQWRGYAVLGVIVLVIALVISQFVGRGEDAPKPEEATTVAPVPEAMLASVRTMVMPLPHNYDCLMGDALFACFAADETTQVLSHLDATRFFYGGRFDVSSLMTLPTDEAKDETPPTDDNPDSPPVATTPAAEEPATADEPQDHSEPPHD